MAGLNKVFLIGNLGADPEVKNLDSGDMVVNLTIATNESWKNKQGEKVDKTTWHRLVAWRKTAELISKYCKKGDKIHIEGKIDNRSYDADDGTKRYVSEIIVNNVVFLGGKKDSDGATATEEATTAAPADTKPKSDLPF